MYVLCYLELGNMMCIPDPMFVHFCTYVHVRVCCQADKALILAENIQHANMQLVTRLAEKTVVTGAKGVLTKNIRC